MLTSTQNSRASLLLSHIAENRARLFDDRTTVDGYEICRKNIQQDTDELMAMGVDLTPSDKAGAESLLRSTWMVGVTIGRQQALWLRLRKISVDASLLSTALRLAGLLEAWVAAGSPTWAAGRQFLKTHLDARQS